jgi:hypothetical protein
MSRDIFASGFDIGLVKMKDSESNGNKHFQIWSYFHHELNMDLLLTFPSTGRPTRTMRSPWWWQQSSTTRSPSDFSPYIFWPIFFMHLPFPWYVPHVIHFFMFRLIKCYFSKCPFINYYNQLLRSLHKSSRWRFHPKQFLSISGTSILLPIHTHVQSPTDCRLSTSLFLQEFKWLNHSPAIRFVTAARVFEMCSVN